MTRRALVTGATGFIGWHLASHLVTAGYDVLAIVRPGRQHALPPGVEPCCVPFEAATIAETAGRADIVFHAAGLRRGHPRALQAVNVDLTQEAAGAARRLGSRFVFISSQSVAGPAVATRPAIETDPPNPATPYAATKLAAERAVSAMADLSWIIVRPTAVYGPRDTQLLPLVRLARLGWMLSPPHRDATYNFAFVDDVVRGLMMAAAAPGSEHQIFFIGQNLNSTVPELASALEAALNRRVRSLKTPMFLLRAAALVGEVARAMGTSWLIDRARLVELRAPGFACSTRRAKDAFGFEGTTRLREGLQRTVAWYRREGWVR